MTAPARLVAVTTALLVAMGVPVGVSAPADAAFDNGPLTTWEPDGPVHAIAVSDGTVYLGGSFTSLSNPATGEVVNRARLAALNATTGELIRAWSPAADDIVRALAVSADGSRVFAGGNFLAIDGENHRRLASLSAADGSVDRYWRPGASGIVRDLAVVDDRLYVGGSFGTLSGVAERGLAALMTSTGKRDPDFSASTNKPVMSLAVKGSTLLASGTFTTVNGAPRASLAAVSLATGTPTGWSPQRLCSTCNTYWDVATDGERVYVGSSGPGGWAAAFVTHSDAPVWVKRTDGDVQAVTVADGLVYFGGHFGVQFGGEPRKQLAAVAPATGAVDPDFAPSMKGSYPGVWALTPTSTRLIVGGHFKGVVRWGRHPYFAAFPTA